MSPDVPEMLVNLTVQFAALAGVAGLIAAVINILKAFGVVKDGQADQWKAGLSLGAFAILALVGVFKPDLTAVILDARAAQVATILIFITGFLVQTGLAPLAHKFFSGFPLIGTSFTRQAQKEFVNMKSKGQGMVEYALILVLVAVVVIAAVTLMGPLVGNVFSTVNTNL